MNNLNTSLVLNAVGDELSPKPVPSPHERHFLDRDVLGLWKEEGDEGGHQEHPATEEEEEAELHMAEH